MANKPMPKMEINTERFKEVLKQKGYTIRSLVKAADIDRDEKTIRRYLTQGEVPFDRLYHLCAVIDVDPEYISKNFDKRAAQVEPDEEKRKKLIYEKLNAEDFPYVRKVKRDVNMDDYWENLLAVHDIPIKLYEGLSKEQQIRLLLALDRAINRVLYEFFPPEVRGESYNKVREFRIVTTESGEEIVEE